MYAVAPHAIALRAPPAETLANRSSLAARAPCSRPGHQTGARRKAPTAAASPGCVSRPATAPGRRNIAAAGAKCPRRP